MTNKRLCLTCLTGLLMAFAWSTGVAGIVNLSLDPAGWEKTSYAFQGPATVTQNGAGHLVGTKTTATGGSSWALGLQTQDSYNFQNAILRYQWRVNSTNGSYSAIYSGTIHDSGSHPIMYFDPNGTPAAYYSTHHSWAGSEVIANNTWLYTQVTVSATGYDYAVSYTGYGDTDFRHGSRAINAQGWADLSDSRFWFRLVDNWTAGTYFELAQATLETNTPSVPEPTPIALIGLGLLGLMVALRERTS